MYTPDVVEKALAEYTNRSDLTGREIAEKYGIAHATLLGWSRRRNKVHPRHAGRRPDKGPSLRHQHILAMASVYTGAEVGRMIGRTRAEVSRIVRKWGLPVLAEPPFRAGDVIAFAKRHSGRTWLVLEASLLGGRCKYEANGSIVENLTWWRSGKMAYRVEPKGDRHDTH